jgi:TDG/mug DNA glycosylase family protein
MAELPNSDVLEDLFEPGLMVVFCGTAAGKRSARLGLPYAQPNNKFWETIHTIGLTQKRLSPANYQELPDFGLGLTDIAKRASGRDSDLSRHDFDVDKLKEKLASFTPNILAFNGKKAASVFYRTPTRHLEYGRQSRGAGETIVWILPSTSGAACRYWDDARWVELAEFARHRGSR